MEGIALLFRVWEAFLLCFRFSFIFKGTLRGKYCKWNAKNGEFFTCEDNERNREIKPIILRLVVLTREQRLGAYGKTTDREREKGVSLMIVY